MFASLTDRLQGIFRDLGRRGKLHEADIEGALREIRLALLEADVHYQVVKDILATVRQASMGEDVSRAINPSQQIINILHQELVNTLGESGKLNLIGPQPRVILLVGLQGSGKTTTTAKLAKRLRSQGERVWMVAADPYRPAAADQLSALAEEINIPVFNDPTLAPPALCAAGIEAAAKGGASVVLLDTAGRSQLDTKLIEELQQIRDKVNPIETLLVADAMTGQEAVNIAQGFLDSVNLSGLILSKMDGDARGGAAISMRTTTGVPIKFIGTGEDLDALETFYPDRLASRIMGMGDVLTLIEKAEAVYEKENAKEQVAKLLHGDFNLLDYAEQLSQMRKLGPLNKILEMLPGGLSNIAVQVDSADAEKKLVLSQAIIQSMTMQERIKPAILNGKRRRRIAAGSGTTVQEVNQLLRTFNQMKKMFKMVGKRGLKGLPPGLR
ncbi:MAG: signal recognition particle protein [Chloroflexi bacterium]|nr:signal recognition particle protein [Chloroflexota bacterium]